MMDPAALQAQKVEPKSPAFIAFVSRLTGTTWASTTTTMEYVTSLEMGLFNRFVSNMKDAIAYFGVRALVRRRPTGTVLE